MKKLLFIACCLHGLLFAADDKPNRMLPECSGYVKYLQQFSFVSQPDKNNNTSLIHNRINLKWDSRHFLVRLEARNRIFYGDQVKFTPGYMKNLGKDPGALPLTKTWYDGQSLGVHSVLDRAHVQYHDNKWLITLGRQRINWGVNMVWNPNDIFNTYNFFDFDYEERPGSDALRVQYQVSGFTGVEAAIKKDSAAGDYTGALMYRTNTRGYDMQCVAGISHGDALLGAGWAGNIGNAGFKGECSWFHPRKNFMDTTGSVCVSMSTDYSFRNGWYFHLSGYYNSSGAHALQRINTEVFYRVSARQLLPFAYAVFFQCSKQFTPLLSGSVSQIYSPAGNVWIWVPALYYNLSDNWEMNLLAQSFFAYNGNAYRSIGNSIYLRFKFSF